MSKKHLSATDFDIMVGDLLVHVESMTATIDDQRKAVKTRGVPTGYVDGEVGCSGDIELDTRNFNLLTEVARTRGSFRDMPPFNILAVGKNIDESQKLELFGCVLNVTDLFGSDGKGGEKQKHKMAFEVSDPDFVRINGVPYLSADNIRDL